MADDKQPHLRPFQPKPLLDPEPGSLHSPEHYRLMREDLPPLRELLIETVPDPKGLLRWDDIANGVEAPYEWLIPGLIEREDRVIVTGDEGYGKSTLLRQIALSACIGENTLGTDPINTHDPIRVLLVDLENSKRHVIREITKLRALLDTHSAALQLHFAMSLDTSGMVLDDPRDKDKDRAQIAALLDATMPDLLIIGPLYKMMGGDPNDEKDAREVARFLDMVRGRYHCALIIEAHAPHNQKRPYGWSGWKRWPERGIHLDNEGQLSNWRGVRGDSVWPERLARGSSAGSQGWPWLPRHGNHATPSDSRAEYAASVELEVMRELRQAGRWLTRAQIVELADRRKSAVLAAIAHLLNRGSIVERHFALINQRGETRPVSHFQVNAEREPESRGSREPDPIGVESAEPAEIVELFSREDDDGPL